MFQLYSYFENSFAYLMDVYPPKYRHLLPPLSKLQGVQFSPVTLDFFKINIKRKLKFFTKNSCKGKMGWLIVSEIWGSIETNLLSTCWQCWHGAGAGAFGMILRVKSNLSCSSLSCFLAFFVFFAQQALRFSSKIDRISL